MGKWGVSGYEMRSCVISECASEAQPAYNFTIKNNGDDHAAMANIRATRNKFLNMCTYLKTLKNNDVVDVCHLLKEGFSVEAFIRSIRFCQHHLEMAELLDNGGMTRVP